MIINNYVSTSEFSFAAFLLTKGCKLERLDRANPKRIRFIFIEVPQMLIDSFWANREVRVIDFVTAQNELKRRIFADVY